MNEGSTIFLVEDDKPLAESIRDYLAGEGFAVTIIGNGAVAVEEIVSGQPDLVILDIMLPGKDGLEVCREIRPKYSGYVIMFTAREDEIDQVVGLELGADDYLVKPVKPRLLLAKVKAFLRRSEMRTESTDGDRQMYFDTLLIDRDKRSVTLENNIIALTSAEFDLLQLLAHRAGSILSRDEITRQLSGGRYDGLDRTIDNKISLLRRKLGDNPVAPTRIKTIRSKGYMFVASAWLDKK